MRISFACFIVIYYFCHYIFWSSSRIKVSFSYPSQSKNLRTSFKGRRSPKNLYLRCYPKCSTSLKLTFLFFSASSLCLWSAVCCFLSFFYSFTPSISLLMFIKNYVPLTEAFKFSEGFLTFLLIILNMPDAFISKISYLEFSSIRKD